MPIWLIVALAAVALFALAGGQGRFTEESEPPPPPSPEAEPDHDCILMPLDGTSARRVRYGYVPDLRGVNLGLSKTLLRYAGFGNVIIAPSQADDDRSINDRDWYVNGVTVKPDSDGRLPPETGIILTVKNYDDGCWGEPKPL